MKHLIAALITPIALFAAPVAAQPLTAGEVELRIEALGDIPADSATIPVQIVGRGKDEAAAKADLAKKERETYAALAKLGIPAAKIKPVADDEAQYPIVTEAAEGYACEEDAAEAARDAAMRMRFNSEPTVIAAPPVLITTSSAPRCNPEVTRSRTLLVTVDDLTKLPAIAKLSSEDYYARTKGTFFHRDEAAAHSAAIAEAIAKARADAEVYAAAMGLRVVRIVRVSNTKPKINWPDLIMLGGGFVSDLDMATAEDMAAYRLRALVAGQFAGVTIDFVLGPK